MQSNANDPGLLVAKGRFTSKSEEHKNKIFRDRDKLLRDGQPGDSLEVVELTQQIEDLNQQSIVDRRRSEKEHVKNLAAAIFMAMSNHGYANVRSVGRNATYNAIKAISIASGYCKSKGIDLCFEVGFDDGNLGNLRSKHHVQNITAIMFRLKDHKDWEKK